MSILTWHNLPATLSLELTRIQTEIEELKEKLLGLEGYTVAPNAPIITSITL